MRRYLRWIAIGWAAATTACGPSREGDTRPSVLLLVMDTTRMDAVSAYGEAEGTTPYLDSLAAEGLLYRWALAPAPWTLPSHATLFTSLGPEEHGVGVAGRMRLTSEHATLAEQLQAAGYETIGFSENPLVMRGSGFGRGFDDFVGENEASLLRLEGREARFDAAFAVRRWIERRRDPARPFFLFVNLFGPHDPYDLHEDTRLPAGVAPEAAEAIGRGGPFQGVAEFAGICDRVPPPGELAVLRGLYLGEVRAADDALRRIHGLLREQAGSLITVVTADHGEHLGEHRLLGHEFSLRGEVLRVPLVVHGLPGTGPGEIHARVGLRDLAPSVAQWTGVEAPASWTGDPLPTTAEASEQEPRERPLLAFFDDAPLVPPEGFRIDHAAETERRRRGCAVQDRVFGPMLSLIRFPFKLIWYAEAEPQLYDLRWDVHERSDLADRQPERVRAMSEELLRWRTDLEAAAGRAAPASEEAVEALRALGYVE